MPSELKEYRCFILNWINRTENGKKRLEKFGKTKFRYRLLQLLKRKDKCSVFSCKDCEFHSRCNKKLIKQLDQLEKWCKKDSQHKYKYNRVQFEKVFRSAILGAKKDYLRNKQKTWSTLGLFFYGAGCIVASPILLELLFSNVVNPLIAACAASESVFGGLKSLISNSGAGLLFGGTVTISVVSFVFFTKLWREQKNYRETWVRHSSRFNRMELALQEFLLYSDKEKEEQFDLFARKIFSISERNLDQFELNMSGKGLADSQKEAK